MSDYGTSCIPTADGGTVLTTGGGMWGGAGVEFGLVRTDVNGEIMWQKTFTDGNYALAKNVVNTSDGGLCVFGQVNRQSSTEKALFLMKTDISGNVLWNYRIEASGQDRPAELIACQSGGFLSCSITNYNTGGYPGALLIRFDEDGQVLWSKNYSILQGVSPEAIVELPNGDFAFVSSVNAQFTGPFGHTLVTRTDAQGVVQWSRMFYGEYDDQPYDLIGTVSGDLYISGAMYRVGKEWDAYLLKVDASGALIQTTGYDAHTASGEHLRKLANTNDGNMALLGDQGSFDARNIVLLKVRPTGEVLWARHYPLSPIFTNYGFDLYETMDQGLLFTGDVRPPGYVRDAALVKTDAQGYLSCYTADASFETDAPVFERMDIFLTAQEQPLAVYEPFTFSDPGHPITVKTVCENLQPIVQFSFTGTTACPQVCVDFTDSSLNAPTEWYWEFEGATPGSSTAQHPQDICYSKPGTYTISLTVKNGYGTTTKVQTISLNDFDCPTAEVPNVFTPNGDGINDLWEFPVYSTQSVLYIYNRWGTLVYQAEGIELSWDGKTQQGLPANEGVYFYKLETQSEVKQGFLHLER